MPMHSTSANQWYAFEVGPLKVISYSTELYYRSTLGPAITQQRQRDWLKAELESTNRSRTPWLVTFGHRPMYCSSVDGDDCTDSVNDRVSSVPLMLPLPLLKMRLRSCVDSVVRGSPCRAPAHSSA